MSIIQLKNIKKIYGNEDIQTVALEEVSLEINEGEFIGIVGTSGSGKSTLLNIIGCMDKASSGECLIDGKNIKNLNNRELSNLRNNTISFIFQHFALLQDYTVYDNVELPLSFRGISKKQKKDKVMGLLRRLNIEDQYNKKPYQLSGGQQQRVAIARCLASDAKIILADEPTGALDKNTGMEVIDILRQLNCEGKTILLITHDINCTKYCSKIINIEDGKIICK